MSKENSIAQLRFFLKEMFQFNTNDLDFGIYRIYNLKRKEIENFIDGKEEQCLEPIINKTLELVSNIEKQVELTSLTAYLKKFNQESLVNDPAANFKEIQLLIDFSKDDQEKENLTAALTASTKEFNITDEIKDKIYNHILGYFEMYYSNGDFGYNNRSRNLYKVPYEADYDGNDTMFHWKHKGSLYIKTGNSFNAIKFKLKHLDKEFELRLETNEESTGEEVARNNNKDTKLKHYKFNRFEEKDGITRIVFNLSDSSTTKADLFKSLFTEVFKSKANLENYLFAKNDKGEVKPIFNDLTDDYDKVENGNVKGIGALRTNRKALLFKVNRNFDKGEKIEIIDDRFSNETLETLYNIDQKLNSFYIGNDSDYFIHENLQDFLTQEKERYIKNHILSDLKSILDGKLDNTTLIITKAFELVSSRIIEFLSAIEEFQKKLFTMKKKVVESEYCLTIDNIDEKYYKEILENKAQLAEWENLFNVKVKTIADLKTQPTVVLDTKFFKEKDGSNPFKDMILGEIENLDENTTGLLISSENYQGLNTVYERFQDKVKCIYIDPPYNTGDDGFVYKDNFRHSSWTASIENRLKIAKGLLNKDGNFLTSIGVEEVFNLKMICDKVFEEKNFIEMFSWTRTLSPSNLSKKSKKTVEYLLCYEKEKNIQNKYKGIANETENDNPLIKKDNEVKTLVFPKDKVECNIKGNHLLTKGIYGTKVNKVELLEDVKIINGKFQSDIKLKANFIWEPKNLENEIKNGTRIIFKTKKSLAPRYDKKEYDLPVPKNLIDESDGVKTNDYEKNRLIDLGFKDKFDYPKPTSLVSYVTRFNTETNDTILDFYAGSGTTGNAIIFNNKANDLNQKFILIEMAKYFEDVTLNRIKKNIYSDNWKDGKPLDNDGSTKIFLKYIILEQYEDVLDAITTEEENEKTEKLLKKLKNERYLIPLKYLYKPELNKINSTLDLSKPFSNKIKYGQPTKEGFVDLLDTYNYLQGYEVKSIKTYTIGKKYYKVVETSDILVIWRDIALGEDDSKSIKEIAEKYPEATQIEVNYDFNILATLKDKQLEVGKRLLGLNVIHVDIFNQ